MATIRTIENLSALIKAISTARPEPGVNDDPCFILDLWDGRQVTASFVKENGPIDISVRELVIKENKLSPYVKKLLEGGKSFVTSTGNHDEVCALVWKIEPKLRLYQVRWIASDNASTFLAAHYSAKAALALIVERLIFTQIIVPESNVADEFIVMFYDIDLQGEPRVISPRSFVREKLSILLDIVDAAEKASM